MKQLTSLFTFCSGVVLFTVAAIPTYAIEIKYNTVGKFNCNGLAGCTVTSNAATGNSTVVVQDGSGNQSTLVFKSAAQDNTYAADNSDFPAVFEAGVVTPSGVKAGDPFVSGLNQVSLDITVYQTIPTPGSQGDFIGKLTGKVSVGSNGKTNSSAKITFDPTTPPSITLDGVIYTLDNNAYSINVNGTSIQGTLDGSALPEPAFFALTGIGFFGMFGIAWSRYKQRA